MVVRISTGQSIRGVLGYNESKRVEGNAKLIGYQGFFPGVENLGIVQLVRRFDALLSLNRRTKTNTVHISLNFAPGEKLSEESLEEIITDYLKRIGFGKQPCLIYQHHDAGHPHVHLVTVNIDAHGKRIETHNMGKNLSEPARKEIEKQYGLVPAEKQQFVGPDIRSLGKLSYAEIPTKAGIQTVLNQVWQNYSFCSFGEYNAILRCYGVEADRGEPDSNRYKRGGLVYQVLDSAGTKKGVPIKASSFYLKPTLKKLGLKFQREQSRRENQVPVVRQKIIGELERSNSLQELEGRLKKQGIDLGISRTATGAVFGLVYVDHQLQVAIKGSDLGKELGATGISKKFGLVHAKDQQAGAEDRVGGQKNASHIPFTTKELEGELLESALEGLDLGKLSDSAYQGPVYRDKKKKKKRQKTSNQTES
ncbi:relaxase/mobilization nuclease domain-containing protein [Algoriphagus litoralis]|uniref:relaxase/mobilization nuclease domain-containing protein n=1 Tax=Algoriphagus litoralis TaxID=2202829 RepID=UPI000DBA4FD9|nr:relaxase/mobilization nuclease domain-containing protein [Algoriphagus litoralis]